MSNIYVSPWYYSVNGNEDGITEPPRKPSKTFTDRIKKDYEGRKFIPESLLRTCLEKFLPKPDDLLADKHVVRDAVIPEISQLLVDYGKPDWSLLPRTFSILWILGIPDKLDAFVAQGQTDLYLPYSEGNLPDAIKGSNLRQKFLKLQRIVQCRHENIEALEDGGKHLFLPGNADNYFYSMQTLGQGRFAKVDEVRSWLTTKIYARKQIMRGESALKDRAHLTAFEKELKSLKTLSHHHVVQLVGSYTDSMSLSIIMSPVADMDLHMYLNSDRIDPDHRKRMLRSFFGCLTTALAYIHDKNVRHKDIKPNNVLVNGDRVLLSDFGTSRICLDGSMTTNGEQQGTPRYWAPEVGDGAVSTSKNADYLLCTTTN
jgi:tRNA A-37 threonylcarbamoyl transferase component Bud32